MIRYVKPLVIVLALPILASALGMLGRARWEARWDPWLGKQLAARRVLPYRGLLMGPSLSTVCAEGSVSSAFAPCATYRLFSQAIVGAAIVGGGSLAFLVGLLAAGRWCRRSRRRMVVLFRPALVVIALGIACLAVAQAWLAVIVVGVGPGALWFEPVQWLRGSLLVGVGVAAIMWALTVATMAFGAIRRPTISLVGEVLDLSEQRRLAEVVRAVSAAVGAAPPDNIVVCLVPWLFVTGMDVTCLDRRVSGRTLCLSLPLARILTVDELRGQLAHDLAHYSRDQEAFTTRVASPLVGVSRALRDAEARSHGIRAAVSVAPLALLSVFVGELVDGDVLDGDRERSADEAAAAVVGREALASGLVKLGAFTPAWDGVVALMQDAAFSDTQYVNSSALFQDIAVSGATDGRLAGVGRTTQGHPVDRHATLGERLASLRVDLRDVAGAALSVEPQPSSASLIDGCEAIERRLSTAEHQLIVETGGRTVRA